MRNKRTRKHETIEAIKLNNRLIFEQKRGLISHYSRCFTEFEIPLWRNRLPPPHKYNSQQSATLLANTACISQLREPIKTVNQLAFLLYPVTRTWDSSRGEGSTAVINWNSNIHDSARTDLNHKRDLRSPDLNYVLRISGIEWICTVKFSQVVLSCCQDVSCYCKISFYTRF